MPKASLRATAFWPCRLVLGLFLLAPLIALAGAATGVGVTRISIPDAVDGTPTEGYVFPPSALPLHGTMALGPYDVAAMPDAPALAGAKAHAQINADALASFRKTRDVH